MPPSDFRAAGIAIFILRKREPQRARPFRIPLYPLFPLFFCATCAYLLYSSVSYASTGAIASIGVVVFGAGVFMLSYECKLLALVFAAIVALAFTHVRSLIFGV